MRLTLHLDRRPGLLLAVATGRASLADLIGLVDMVAAITHEEGQQRVLVNLLAVENSFTFTDHLQLGTHAAGRLQHLQRAASVVPALLRTGTSEKAAQKLGLQLRVFTELAPALDWVAEGLPPG